MAELWLVQIVFVFCFMQIKCKQNKTPLRFPNKAFAFNALREEIVKLESLKYLFVCFRQKNDRLFQSCSHTECTKSDINLETQF
jgi:hypothetical protein